MSEHGVGSVLGNWQWLANAEGVSYYFNTTTSECVWEKPEVFMTDLEKEQSTSEYVWCPHPELAFVPGRLLQRLVGGNGPALQVEQMLPDGSRATVTVPEKGCLPIDSMAANTSDAVEDLVQLSEVNEPSIVHLLRARFAKDKIYTWIGTILVAVNPFKQIPLYTPAMVEKVMNRGPVDAAPHTFVIADTAYKSLRRFRRGQSILISGESGAGKTETTKHALTYLSEVAGGAAGVEQKVLAANPILEAFGNAKTLRNNNSSRFGKLMSLAFSEGTFEICGRVLRLRHPTLRRIGNFI